jgi:membrane protein DedA with SNARE-associated domain
MPACAGWTETMNLGHLISTYGYGAVFVLVAVESLGIPLPGETILITAAIYAGSTHRLSPWLLWAVAAAAAVVGDNIGFWIGDKGGYRLLRRYGRYIRVRETEVKVGRLIFDRHGGKVVFFGRFVSVLRTYAAFLAGTLKMRWRRFSLFNVAGGIVWSGIYTWASYGAGHAIQNVSHTATIVLGVVAAVVVVAAIVVVRRKAKNLEAEAEAAYPGPLPAR